MAIKKKNDFSPMSKRGMQLLDNWQGTAPATAKKLGVSVCYAKRLACTPAFKEALRQRQEVKEQLARIMTPTILSGAGLAEDPVVKAMQRVSSHSSARGVVTKASRPLSGRELRAFWASVIRADPEVCSRKVIGDEVVLEPPDMRARLEASRLLAKAKGLLKDIVRDDRFNPKVLEDAIARAQGRVKLMRVK